MLMPVGDETSPIIDIKLMILYAHDLIAVLLLLKPLSTSSWPLVDNLINIEIHCELFVIVDIVIEDLFLSF